MRSQLLSGPALAAAAVLLAAAPPPANAQTSQPQQAQPSRADTPGRPAIPASDVEYSKAMERLFQSAQRLRESVQAMAQQPAGDRRNQAMAQAREALLHTQQAMVSLPANLRTGQNYRDAEQRVGEAEKALGGNEPDGQRALGAADALLVVVPKLESDARAATGVPLQRAQSLVGTNVIGANGQEAGEIENLLVDRGGQVRAAVVQWGGFLGLGEKSAVVPMDKIELGAAGNDKARMNLSREQLEQLPRYERDRLAEYASRYGWGDGVRLFR